MTGHICKQCAGILHWLAPKLQEDIWYCVKCASYKPGYIMEIEIQYNPKVKVRVLGHVNSYDVKNEVITKWLNLK